MMLTLIETGLLATSTTLLVRRYDYDFVELGSDFKDTSLELLATPFNLAKRLEGLAVIYSLVDSRPSEKIKSIWSKANAEKPDQEVPTDDNSLF